MPRRRHWLRLSLVLLFLLTLVTVTARFLVRDRQRVMRESEAQLHAAVELELKTIADRDEELFRSRQDPEDADWRNLQVSRYFAPGTDALVPTPGLALADLPFQIQRVHVTGRVGLVELVHWFLNTNDSKGYLSELLPFHATWLYRQADDGTWYHGALSEEHRDGPVSKGYRLRNTGPFLEEIFMTVADQGVTILEKTSSDSPKPQLWFHATQAEAALLESIGGEMVDLISQACEFLECPERGGYTLLFEETTAPGVRGSRWTLPTLQKYGSPGNRQARAAWQRGVLLWIVEALVRSQIDNPRAADRVIFQQLIRRMQAGLGLVEPVFPDLELLSVALAEHDGLTLWQLWEGLRAEDTAYSQLYEIEVTVLLDFIEELVGAGRLFEILAALGRNESFDTVLWSRYSIDPGAFKTAWAARLSELTGIVVRPEPALPAGRQQHGGSEGLLISPPLPPPPKSPGNEVALVCENQIWVGNLDGTQLVPLTAVGQRFYGLDWSPDGQWLLARWQYDSKEPPSGLYLLASDGTQGYLLINGPSMEAVPLGWRPDGREIIFYWRSLEPAAAGEGEFITIDIASRERSELPGVPRWSPDGKKLAYVSHVSGVPVGPVWLADADWNNARQIAVAGWVSRGSWTPAGDKLAFVLIDGGVTDDGPVESIVVYDLVNERIQLSIDPVELVDEIVSTHNELVGDRSDLITLMDAPEHSFSPLGWSADGSRLLIEGRGFGADGNAAYPHVLVVVPMDGSPAQLVACRVGGYWEDVFWSPTDAKRLIFAWRPHTSQPWNREAYLFHLTDGLIYVADNSGHVAWSPNGKWAAFTTQDHVAIVDRYGREEHYPLPSNLRCDEFAWNPATDLSGLGEISAIEPGTK